MTAGSPLPVFLVILTSLLLFVALWLLVTTLLSTLSGWPALAAAFPGGPIPPGTRLRGQVIGLGAIQEKNVTTLIACPQGLYLYALFLFRLRRPPVLVPWSQVRCLERKRFLWNRWYVLDLGGVTTLRVRQGVAPALRAHGVTLPPDD